MKRINRIVVFLSLAMGCLLLAGRVYAYNLPDFTDLVEDAAPAVVNISTVKNSSGNHPPIAGMDQENLPEIFRHFFGRRGTPQEQPQQSLGSGFIISDDGYILTNNHVVEGADKIIVRLSDRREMEAAVIGLDKRTDLALLKIDGSSLPVVELGDSASLKAGEWVLAIGSPFGFDHSVTAGIISAVNRSLPNENYVPFIQTDVAINPGNSGGPLFNLDGEVVGINSQIYTRSGGFMGLSFAIPIDVAMNVADQLKEKGRVARGWLGVVIQEVNRDLAESFGLRKPMGALVVQVASDGPAGKGGIQEGDIILEFEGQEIHRSGELPPLVGQVRPGDKAQVLVLRSGSRKMLNIEIEELPDQRGARRTQQEQPADRIGLKVAELTSEQKQRWNVEQGVVIVAIEAGSAARSGLREGDVITMVGSRQINSVDDYRKAIGLLKKDQSVPVRVVRQGEPAFVPLKIE
ncbi:DegQ family serine endoprotease [Oceanospirillum linum]|uniref:Probable periplasmic serine endoprotease DegP-like n=1 Tax=Oceanospirillum linum TaxID=966 RepID=A0A1T1HF81_OCELI|nr:DegQ family serine endoprotease [Oceanospirillum linum]OOV88380.1 serine peptidase [Oceanospirillum linum]SEF54228.1 serine protease Do [Oleiphilus messinensis]SMP04871.1 serine protease Do [Oceanospirillum linum]